MPSSACCEQRQWKGSPLHGLDGWEQERSNGCGKGEETTHLQKPRKRFLRLDAPTQRSGRNPRPRCRPTPLVVRGLSPPRAGWPALRRFPPSPSGPGCQLRPVPSENEPSRFLPPHPTKWQPVEKKPSSSSTPPREGPGRAEHLLPDLPPPGTEAEGACVCGKPGILPKRDKEPGSGCPDRANGGRSPTRPGLASLAEVPRRKPEVLGLEAEGDGE